MRTKKQSSKEDTQGQSLATLVSHPLRIRILIALVDGGPASPNQLQAILGEQLGNVAYHMRVLQKAGCVEIVEEKQRRGAIEHFYAPVHRPTLTAAEHAALPLSERLAFDRWVCQLAFSDVSLALDAGTFSERPNHAAVRVQTKVDEKGWERLATVCERFYEEVEEIRVESGRRLAEDPNLESIPITTLAMLFERAERAMVSRDVYSMGEAGFEPA